MERKQKAQDEAQKTKIALLKQKQKEMSIKLQNGAQKLEEFTRKMAEKNEQKKEWGKYGKKP